MSIVVTQMVNYTLAFLMWMVVGRALLTRLVGDRRNILLLAFVKVTEPVHAVTRKILPFAGESVVPLLSFLLLAAVRVALIVLLRPATGR